MLKSRRRYKRRCFILVADCNEGTFGGFTWTVQLQIKNGPCFEQRVRHYDQTRHGCQSAIRFLLSKLRRDIVEQSVKRYAGIE